MSKLENDIKTSLANALKEEESEGKKKNDYDMYMFDTDQAKMRGNAILKSMVKDLNGYTVPTLDGRYLDNANASGVVIEDDAGLLTSSNVEDALEEILLLIDNKANISNVLELDNTDSFTPDADYEPATKKYVDDNVGGGGSAESIYQAMAMSFTGI